MQYRSEQDERAAPREDSIEGSSLSISTASSLFSAGEISLRGWRIQCLRVLFPMGVLQRFKTE